MSAGLITALWLTPLVAFVVYVWRQSVLYRREIREDRERYYADIDGRGRR